MSGEVQKWHLQKWLEKERPGTWRGLDIVHIDAIIEAYQQYVKDSDSGFLDITLEVFLARWKMLAKKAEEADGGVKVSALYWEQRRK